MSDVKPAPPTYEMQAQDTQAVQHVQQPQLHDQYQAPAQYQTPQSTGQYHTPQPVQPQAHYGDETKGAGQAPQGYPQTGNVMPIASLTSAPAPIQCPSCHQRAMTKVEAHSGNTTHAWAAGLCVLTCCCCIPYCVTSTKDVEQRCSNCNAHVATWHRSGRTVVHIH